MKPVSEALREHLEEGVTSLALCWRVTRRDGIVMGFTSHETDLEIEGVSYRASVGFLPSAIDDTNRLSVDNMEVEGILSDDSITQRDIIAGRYDFAEIVIFLVNFEDVSLGSLTLRHGWLGEVTVEGERFTAELRGLTERLGSVFGSVYSPNCRAHFADNACGLVTSEFERSGTVEEVIDARRFRDSALSAQDGLYSYGVVRFTSGQNEGLLMEVKLQQASQVTLSLSLPYPLSVGDEYVIRQGCDKSFATCRDRFANSVNFRGEPHVPGMDRLLETSSTRRS